MIALTACGGEDECEHLAETCEMCTDANVKAACKAVADSDDHAMCESVHAMYDNMCES
jgi:hypothetical protein